mgnify:CR=1 FL=1
MKKLLLAVLLCGAAPVFAADISVGIVIGPPPAPRVYAVRPPAPGPEFLWVQGYWYPVGRHYRWHDGYWTRAPYPGAVWMMPRWQEGRYYNGYWEGRGRRFEHDHHWDHDEDRDYHRHGRHRDWDDHD